jgi:hypothetical protein
MKYICLVGFLMLAGCGYDLSELNAAKAACASANGRFSTGTVGASITSTYCSIDHVRYRIGRTTQDFMSGEQE